MAYFQGSPPPQALLANANWRLRNSLWMLPAIVGCSMLTWTSFLYIGIRAKRTAWLIAAVVYGVLFAAAIVFVEIGDGDNAADADLTATQKAVGEWGGGVMVAVWIAGIVHVAIVRRHYLEWLAYNSGQWWAKTSFPAPQPLPMPRPLPMAQPNPAYPATLLGTDHQSQQYWAPGHRPPPPVDVNVANEAEFRSLGLRDDAVAALLNARRQRGGFASIQEFAAAAGLKPHELSAVSARITIPAPPPQPVQHYHSRGRRLDL